METKSTTQLQASLKDIMASEPDTIRAMVAEEALEYGSEDIHSFFHRYPYSRLRERHGRLAHLLR